MKPESKNAKLWNREKSGHLDTQLDCKKKITKKEMLALRVELRIATLLV